MYVCICNALRERDVHHSAAEGGVRSAADFFDLKCLRPVCSKCVPELHRMVRDIGAAEGAARPPKLRVVG